MEHTLCMLVAQGTFAHVSQLDGAFRARIHEPVAALGVELGSSDDLRKLFHVCGLDVDNVKTLVLDVEIPKVDTKIIAADEGFAVAIH